MDKSNKIRLHILWFFMCFFWIALIWQFFNIQVLQHSHYSEKAKKQYYQEENIPASRGVIFDRNHEKMAVDLQFFSFGANPRYIKHPKAISTSFSNYFAHNNNYYLSRLRSKKSFVWLEKKVGMEKAENITRINDPGLVVVKSFRRYYPHGTIAGQLVGFTNTENEGLSGIEMGFDPLLKGLDGRIILFADGKRNEITDIRYPMIEPVGGANIVLTIDLIYQTILDEELSACADNYSAKSAVAVLMQPHSGEILAMSSYPLFNPNDTGNKKFDTQKIKAITNTYEPGSIFKIVSAAAILEEKAMSPDDTVYCENGRYKLHRRTITDHEPYGKLSFREVIEHSSNIGTAKIIHKISTGKFYQHIRNFGFGCETGVQIPGEVNGFLANPSKWSKQSQASISYGYEIGVTPLQIASAYCAVANGGTLYQPIIIKEIVDNRGNVISKSKPQKIRKVLSGSTSKILLSFLQGTVENGTGKTAAVSGLNIGGKTGTARRLDENGKYTRKYLSSFTGVWPIENPEFVCVVMIVEPIGAYYGSAVAAPVVKNIAQRISRLNNESLSNPGNHYFVNSEKINSKNRTLPAFYHMNKEEAILKARMAGLIITVKGRGDSVISQNPVPESLYAHGDRLTLLLGKADKTKSSKTNKMPDLVGLSMREAVNLLNLNNIKYTIKGSGKVSKQSCKPGKPVNRAGKIEIECAEAGPQ